MKIGIAGPSYEQRSLPFDAQRSINFFPVFDQQGKEVVSLYSVPGKTLFGTAGAGPGRGFFTSSSGRVFAVSGTGIYEVDSAGTTTLLGSLLQSTGIVTIAENDTQLAVCDGQSIYILTYATNAWAKVTDPDLPSVGTITYSDGYFIVNENNSGRFYVSALRDGTNWTALNFATAENSPDNLKCVTAAVGQLWLFGNRTTEIWTNTGDSAFPFRRISGAVMEAGISSPFTTIEIDNGIMFVGQDEFGSGIVYKTSGYTPMRVSTTAIEKRIQEATDIGNMRAWAYQEEGAVFYVLTGGGLETSLVYDLTTQLWHERARLNDDGELEQDIAECHTFAFGKHLVLDRLNGNIYEMSLDYYDDAGSPLVRERVYTHLSDEGKRIRYNTLEIGFETGVGLQSGQGSDPLVSLQLSKDGARTYTDWVTKPIGKVGQYGQKVEFRRLGVAEQLTIKIRITDPVKVAITGSYLS
jgi:hypothetical protein